MFATQAICPREFTDAAGNPVDPGYHNAALPTTGVALLFPPGSRGALVQTSGGMFLGVRGTDTLAVFSDDNYGSILGLTPCLVARGHHEADATRYLHVASWTGTVSVSVVFF